MATTTTGECGKCSGTGRIRGFGHIDNGRCFQCGGDGKIHVSKRGNGGRTVSDAQLAEMRAAWVLEMRAAYARHFARACRHFEGLTAAEFREMARPHAEWEMRDDGHYSELQPNHWVAGAHQVVCNLPE